MYYIDNVYLVDHEYAGPDYLAFDIANHFCEYAGMYYNIDIDTSMI